MCVNYTPKQLQGKLRRWTPLDEAAYPRETWPGYPAPIYTREDDQSIQTPADLPFRGTMLARFGLIPFRSTDPSKVRNTQNARAETVDKLWSYKPAWERSQLCLVPMQRFFEPDWRTGKSIRTAIQRRDGDAFTIAGIWDRWIDKSSGEVIASFSMLTINADSHPMMSQFHKAGDEKRSLVVIPEELRDEWLEAKPDRAKEFLQSMPVTEFTSEPAPLPPRPKKPNDLFAS